MKKAIAIRKYLIWAVIIILAGLGLVSGALFFRKGPDLSKYEALRDPRITNLPDQRMLEVRVTGDPNKVGGKAFKHLFKTYLDMRHDVGDLEPSAPRSRWLKPLSTPRDQWVEVFGLPIPDSVTTLPKQDTSDGVKAEIATWKYGETAEILHVGPYDAELPTVERLLKFIKKQGYVIVGPHEEEYVKGPGVLFRGDPNKYYTVIRYQVKKR